MAKPILLSSGTSNQLDPWVHWYYQYGKALSSAEIKKKEQTLLQYVNEYFHLITSDVGGYKSFRKYTIFSRFAPSGRGLEFHEYEFVASLLLVEKKLGSKTTTTKTIPLEHLTVESHLMINGISAHAEGNPSPPLPYILTSSKGLSVTVKPYVGSGGSGTPPPPPKPGG